MNAYDELYLDDAMDNMGTMIEHAVGACGLEPDDFMNWFVSSGVASKFEKGNPKYVAGMSGIELAELVVSTVALGGRCNVAFQVEEKGREYWAGWILAYYQWMSGRRFEEIVEKGLPLSKILSMYIMHEADVSKFVESAESIIERAEKEVSSPLQRIRKARGFTQQKLSEVSGVSLRMIQLYEQRQNDIRKAQVNVVMSLAWALGCSVEDLIG